MGAVPLLIVAIATVTAILLRKTCWADVSLRISRWTFGIVMPLSLLYFPVRSGFRVHAVQCAWTFNLRDAIAALSNYPHMAGFVVFFLLAAAQIPSTKHPIAWSLAMALFMGFLIEIAEGATGIHHCKMHDLIPDMTGALIGAIIFAIVLRLVAR